MCNLQMECQYFLFIDFEYVRQHYLAKYHFQQVITIIQWNKESVSKFLCITICRNVINIYAYLSK